MTTKFSRTESVPTKQQGSSDGSKRTRSEQDVESIELSCDIFSGLPNDVALLILARVHYSCLHTLYYVSSKLRQIVTSRDFLNSRIRAQLASELVFVVDSSYAFSNQYLKFFDAFSGKWTAVSGLAGVTAGFLLIGFRMTSIGHEIFILGGNKDGIQVLDSAPSSDVWKFETNTRKWHQLTPMLNARAHFACASIGTSIYVAGGSTRGPISSLLGKAEVYDLQKGSWKPLPSMKLRRSVCDGLNLNGRFLVVGGGPRSKAATSAELFDPEIGKWMLIEGMLSSLNTFPATLGEGFTVFHNKLYHLDSSGDIPCIRVYSEEENKWEVDDTILWSPITFHGSKLHSLRGKLCIIGGSIKGLHSLPSVGLDVSSGCTSDEDPLVYLCGEADDETTLQPHFLHSPRSVNPPEKLDFGRLVSSCTTVYL